MNKHEQYTLYDKCRKMCCVHTEEHDCDGCSYLGSLDYQGVPIDFYYCPNEPTLVARYGPDGDYSSGMRVLPLERINQ